MTWLGGHDTTSHNESTTGAIHAKVIVYWLVLKYTVDINNTLQCCSLTLHNLTAALLLFSSPAPIKHWHINLTFSLFFLNKLQNRQHRICNSTNICFTGETKLLYTCKNVVVGYFLHGSASALLHCSHHSWGDGEEDLSCYVPEVNKQPDVSVELRSIHTHHIFLFSLLVLFLALFSTSWFLSQSA